MSLNIAGINIPEAIINLEYQVIRTQNILDWVLRNNSLLIKPDQNAMNRIDEEAVKILQNKYPDAGIGKKS